MLWPRNYWGSMYPRTSELSSGKQLSLGQALSLIAQIITDIEVHSGTSDAPASEVTFWTVKLFCGHVSTSVITEVGWTPEEGPRWALAAEKRCGPMRAEFGAMGQVGDG